MTDKPPGIFVSYAHADARFAIELGEDLKRCGARVWIDKGEIKVGDSLIERIRSGIDETDYLAVVLSPDSVQSEWVRREVLCRGKVAHGASAMLPRGLKRFRETRGAVTLNY